MKVEKTLVDATKKGVKIAETSIRKAWTILDAAAEKEKPSDYLSKANIMAIQGRISQFEDGRSR